MKNKTLELIKKECEQEKEEQKELKKKYDRKLKLEENKWVKEYLQLCEELSNVHFLQERLNYTDTEILIRVFRSHCVEIGQSRRDKTGYLNDIYVYIGTYMRNNTVDIEHGSNDYEVNRDSKKADYRLYRSLEDEFDIQRVHIANCDEFERKHKVIIPKTLLLDSKYYEIQKEFIELCVKHGQEEACKQMLEKYQ